MAEDSRDILMRMIPKSTVMPTECQALISDSDTMATAAGFAMITKSGQGSPSPNYFTVDDFTFEVSLQNKEKQAQKGLSDLMKAQHEENEKRDKALIALHPEYKNLMGASGGGSSSKFKRFIMEGRSALQSGADKTFVADLAEISITKRMDVSSPALLGYCLNREQFQSATLIKRRAMGADSLRTYLKIEFNQLMLTSFDWADDDVVKETFKFICRQAIVTYAVEDVTGAFYVQPSQKWEVAKFGQS